MKIKYTFPSGLEVIGSIDEIEKIAKTMGVKLDYKVVGTVPRGYYPSESRGLTKISSMSDFHIRRALLKRSKDYFSAVYEASDSNKVFLGKFLNLTEDSIIQDLFSELKNRG
jgi:hypothetical protein